MSSMVNEKLNNSIIIISEHYYPLVGGTSELTHQISLAISQIFKKVYLLVPSDNNENTIDYIEDLEVHKIGICSNLKSDLKKQERLLFVKKVNNCITQFLKLEKIDIIHVLHGMYVMQYIDFNFFKNYGCKLIATVINVPPQECGSSWRNDILIYRLKDFVKKGLIKIVNKYRITKYNWDVYTTISECGRRLLSEYIEYEKIKVIPLGCDTQFTAYHRQEISQEKIRILTVGGFVPHKNQHLIPTIAKLLVDSGYSFNWDIIGPVRNNRYYNYITNKIIELKLENIIKVTKSLKREELYDYYKDCHIYVQPSIEEGFCLTALDAVLFGKPLIGTDGNNGSIQEFIKKGKGKICKDNPKNFSDNIIDVIENYNSYIITKLNRDDIYNYYKWENIGDMYQKVYRSILG